MNKLTRTQSIGIIIAALAVILLAVGVIAFLFTNYFSASKKTSSPAANNIPAATAVSAATPSQIAASASASDSAPSAASAPSGASQSNAATGEDATQPSGSTEETAAKKPTEPATLPDEMAELLERGGASSEELYGYGCSQLVVVNSSGSTAEISFFERTNGVWSKDSSLTCQGYVGSNGTTDYMSEGASATPRGLYSVGEAFYQYDAPATGLDSFHITSDTYWVDDPDSDNYNKKVVGDEKLGDDHAEHMSEISSYRYGFVINYNTSPTEYGKGSAIFFHVSHDSPTLGCIATSENMVLAYLAKLKASSYPYILII